MLILLEPGVLVPGQPLKDRIRQEKVSTKIRRRKRRIGDKP